MMAFTSRRRFLRSSSAAALMAGVPWRGAAEPASSEGELLYNGIRLPTPWPPRHEEITREPMPVPYLRNPPPLIPIDTGRQLFVDDFLIERSTLARRFHTASIHPASPILKPEPANSWEKTHELATAMTFSDGVWYDPRGRLFKMWYVGGFLPGATCFAQSRDGVHWEKPLLDIQPGTNIVHRRNRDSSTVWMDLDERDPQRRFKLALVPIRETRPHKMELYFSGDGVHWSEVAAESGPCGDRTTFFYNPFRKVWVYSVRAGTKEVGRCRKYWENVDFLRGAAWSAAQPTFWVGADRLDPPNPEEPDARTELYTLDAVAYESILLGAFSITRRRSRKGNDLVLGFSRDGFHWDRPERRAFVPTSPQRGDWNFDYLHSAGGCCLIVGDRLHFYVGGRSDAYSNPSAFRSVGLATLRRDGFASMEAGAAGGDLTTRPVQFSGKHLFVNADAQSGELRVEVLDQEGRAIEPFTAARCLPVREDKTLAAVTWKGVKDLSRLAGRPVRFRFRLQSASLYAFWVSQQRTGASRGFVAAGGPAFNGPTDTSG
jgi:hypothetical protein